MKMRLMMNMRKLYKYLLIKMVKEKEEWLKVYFKHRYLKKIIKKSAVK